MTRNRLFLTSLAFVIAMNIAAQSLIHSVTLHPLGPNDKKPQLLGDRLEYWADDVNGQFYVQLDAPTNAPARSLKIALKKDGGSKPIAETTQPSVTENKAHFLLRLADLKPGKYEVTAALVDAAGGAIGSEQSFKFTRTDKRNAVVTIPADGIPIQLEEQSILPDATWPVRAGLPLPVNAVTESGQLALFENGRPVPAKVTPLGTWCPPGSVQWMHVDFLGKYNGGKPAEYRLKVLPASTSPLTSNPLPRRGEEVASQGSDAANPSPLAGEGRVRGVRCIQTNNVITVDTGAIRFVVDLKKFAGIETAWFDPSASDKYDEANPVIKGAGGPYLVDGRIIRFDASNDVNAAVIVEEQGPTRVTIRAEGWYVNPEGRVDPMCKFVTRISAFAGQPFLRISQHTIITCDTRMYRIRDLGFRINSTLGESFRLGADGATKEAALPAAPATVYLHQDRFDHFRVVGMGTNKVEGAKSDGWFSIHTATNSPSPLSSPPAGRGNTNAPSKQGISSPLGGEGRGRGVVLTEIGRAACRGRVEIS